MNALPEDAGQRVLVNGQPQPLIAGASLAALLRQLGAMPESVATAVNGEFVARAVRADWLLSPGDEVTLFQPIVGG